MSQQKQNPTSKVPTPQVTVQEQLRIGVNGTGGVAIEGPALQNFAFALGLLQMAIFEILEFRKKQAEQLIQEAKFLPPVM
jgi:hypothetical protein